MLPITEQVGSFYVKFSEGKKYELAVKDGAINATDLAKIKDANGEVTRSYDPAYMNTVACVSSCLIIMRRSLKYHTLMETREY